MFWYNVISHNSSYYFKMYISEITKKNQNKKQIKDFISLQEANKTWEEAERGGRELFNQAEKTIMFPSIKFRTCCSPFVNWNYTWLYKNYLWFGISIILPFYGRLYEKTITYCNKQMNLKMNKKFSLKIKYQFP